MNCPDMPEVPCLKGLLPHGWVCCTGVTTIDAVMMIVVVAGWDCCDAHKALTMFLLCLSVRSLAAPKLISTTAFLIAFIGLVLQLLWCPTMMALIASIAIGSGLKCIHRNWQWRRCLLSLVTTMQSCEDVASEPMFLTSLSTKGGIIIILLIPFILVLNQATGQSILIGGLSFAVNWSNQLFQETVLHAILHFWQSNKQSVKAQTMILATGLKSRAKQSRASWSCFRYCYLCNLCKLLT